MNYDGTTTNGIGYIVRLYKSNYRYKEIVDDLDTMKPARMAFLLVNLFHILMINKPCFP